MEPVGGRVTVEPSRTLTELRRGTVTYCVLALLGERERYAVEVVQELALTGVLASGQGTIYPLLRRLRTDGLVETTWRDSELGPPRRYYRLTATGLAALVTFREEWERFRNGVDDLLWKGTG